MTALPLTAALFAMEWWACSRVLIGVGGEPASSLVLGAGLAAGIFSLAGFCSRKPTRKLVYAAAVAVFSLLIIALTILRMREVATDDGDVTTDLASAIVLVVLSLGPAFLGEVVLGKALAALRVRRDLKVVRRHLRAQERLIDGADNVIGSRTAARDTWDHQHAIVQAEYRRVWDITVRRREMEAAKAAKAAGPEAPTEDATT